LLKKLGLLKYVSLKKLGLFSKEVGFYRGIIISLRRRSFNCLGEQLKPSFPCGTIMSPKDKELKLP